MIKKVLLSGLLMSLLFTGSAQQPYAFANAKPAGLSSSAAWTGKAPKNLKVKSSNIQDESGYYFNNAYVMNGGSGSYNVDPLKVWASGATGATQPTFSQAEQFIPNSAAITLDEVSFLGMAMDPTATVQAVVVIQDKGFNYITHEFVTVSSFNKYTATLATPVSLSDTFMVVVAPYSSSDSLYIGVTDDYGTTLPYQGNGYFVEYSTATQSFVNAFTPGNGGGDFIIWPKISYVFDDVTSSATCLNQPNQTISFNSPNEGVLANPIWNYNAWAIAQGAPVSSGYYYTDFEVVEDAFQDNNQQVGMDYTFATAGSYTVNYTERIWPWTSTANVEQLNTFNITDCSPTPITVTSSATNATCNGANNGTATATVTGGTAPYTYLWNDPNTQTTATATNLLAGTFTVLITDANGTTATQAVTVTEPTALNISNTSSTDATCVGCADGTATVNPTGATAPYTYLWDDANGQTTATATNLPAGTYEVLVTDANGCTSIVLVVVNQNAATSINSLDNGVIQVYPNPASNYIVINVQNGKTLTVLDALGRKIIYLDIRTTARVDVSKFKNGTYLYQVISQDNQLTVGKFIVKK